MKALKEAGASKILKVKIDTSENKKEMNNLLEVIKSGDTLVVTKTDRIARSLSQLEKIVSKVWSYNENL